MSFEASFIANEVDVTLERSDAPETNENYTSVFQQAWFMQAASQNNLYHEVVVEEDGVILGRLPYALVRNKFGLTWGGAGYWTHLAGPIIQSGLSAEKQEDVIYRLLNQLSRNVRFKFVCRPNANVEPAFRKAYARAGFSSFTTNTYLFPSDDPGVLSRFKKKHRTHMKAAAKHLEIVDVIPREFFSFYKKNLRATNKVSYEPLNFAESIAQAGLDLSQPRIRLIAARKRAIHGADAVGHDAVVLDAALACVWDDECCFLWMLTYRSGSDDCEAKPHPDAVKLLVVEAVEHARLLGLAFDLDGVSGAGSDNFYKKVIKAPYAVHRIVFRRQRQILQFHTYLTLLKKAFMNIVKAIGV